MYLMAGAVYTVEELLYGLMLLSGNDAAAALADHCAGDMASFAALMNEKAEELGLQNTHFMNSHGLDAEDHYSSARDLALLTAAAMENRAFSRIFGTRTYTLCGTEIENHNKLLTSYEGCLGGKTGYTKAAGRVLVSCAERDGLRLICVTISDPDDWVDHAALYDAAFATYRYLPLPDSSWAQLPLISGIKDRVQLVCDEPGFIVPKSVDAHLIVRHPRFVFAPTIHGLPLGTAELYVDGRLLETVDISAAENVPLDSGVPLSAWERFKRAWFPALSGDGQAVRTMLTF
jgi:D-alanyl-D-alanine carboxypeptidase (penicillin-binding protein 5/6)